MKDWNEHYRNSPSILEFHRRSLNQIAGGTFFLNERGVRALATDWLSVAVYNNHSAAISRLLDELNVVRDESLTVRQRLAIYQLNMGEN